MAVDDARGHDGYVRRTCTRLLPTSTASETIIGALVVGAVLAAQSQRRESYGTPFASALIAVAMYWLAHSYAFVLGLRLEGRQRLTPRVLRAGLRHDWPVFKGAAIPFVCLAIAWATGASEPTAVEVGIYGVVVSIVLFALASGVLLRAKGRDLIREVAVSVALGLGLILLEVILH